MPTVSNTVTDPSGDPIAGVQVVIRLIATIPESTPAAGFLGPDDETIVSQIELITDALGEWSTNLVANSLITPAGTYYVVTERPDVTPRRPAVKYRISVPDSVGPHWAGDLLTEAPDDLPSAVSVAASVSFAPTGTISATNVQAAIAEVAAESGTTVRVPASGGDDTAALQAAITALAALPLAGRTTIELDAGTYTISAALTGVPAGLRIVGKGRNRTWVNFTASGDVVMFNLGTFQASPATYSVGTTSPFTLEHLSIDIPGTSYVNAGSRSHTCIQDNGNGNVTLHQVDIAGFKRGFWGAYGSDFSVVNESAFRYCDVGMYLGPASQQVGLRDIMFLGCEEGLVIDGSPQGVGHMLSFIDSGISHITIEANATTRSGVAAPGAASYEESWAFEDTWFESNADGGGTRIPTRFVWLAGSLSANLPRYVRLTNSHIVGGGAANGSRAFVEVDSGIRLVVENSLFSGAACTYAVRVDSANFPTVVQRNTYVVDGSSITKWGTSGGGSTFNCVYEEPAAGERRSSDNTVAAVWAPLATDVGGSRIVRQANGVLDFGFNSGGTWFERVRLDIQNYKLIFGSDSTIRRIAAARLGVVESDLEIELAGKGLRVKEGSNAKQGTATLVAGTVTVSNTSVTATSRIFLTVQSLGTVAAPKAIAVTARTAATSFTITSADATDTSVVAWEIFEPA